MFFSHKADSAKGAKRRCKAICNTCASCGGVSSPQMKGMSLEGVRVLLPGFLLLRVPDSDLYKLAGTLMPSAWCLRLSAQC